MMEVLYLMFVKKVRINALLISKNEGNAIRLLAPYRAVLEANPRIIKDYGTQQRVGKWAEEEFITRGKCSFRGVGMGQNPRGAKLDELRVNVLIFDDADDDEVCRNSDRLQQNWEWVEKSAIPTVDISADYWIAFDNNIIAEDSLAVRAAEYATDVELVNIRDENGVSSWKEKNSEKDIDDILNSMSYESSQSEYFNNPTTSGKTFEDIYFEKCPPLSKFHFIINYADPSTSNNDKPTAKSKALNSCKVLVSIGYLPATNKFYVLKGWCDHKSNDEFVNWLYEGRDFVGDKTQLYTYIENNTLQNPFYEQVLMPIVFAKGKEKGGVLMVTPDTTQKPDKWFRIEGTLQPLNKMGLLVFNIDEKDNPHMKRIVAQFKNAKPTSKLLDAPDATQGGVKIIQNKIAVFASGGIETIARPSNSKRY